MSKAKYKKSPMTELVRPDGKGTLDDCKSWPPETLTEFVEKNGVVVGDAMIRHNISGDIFHLMCRQDFVDIGMNCVGDILRLMYIIEVLQKQQRIIERDEVHWEGTEYRPSLLQNLCCQYACCCYLCRPTLDTYKITNTSIDQTSSVPATCCFCIKVQRGCCAACLHGCCGTEYAVNRTEISAIRDVDITERTTGCCYRCFGVRGVDDILITTDLQGEQSSVSLHVKQGRGDEILGILRDVQAEKQLRLLPAGGRAG